MSTLLSSIGITLSSPFWKPKFVNQSSLATDQILDTRSVAMFVLPKPAELENRPVEAPDLIIRLTIYAFSCLYPSYQLQAVTEISSRINIKSKLPLSAKSEADCRLRTFTELYESSSAGYQRRIYPSTIVEILKQQIKDTHGVSSEHHLHIIETFLGSSLIWFKGQTVDVQRLVIEELFDIVHVSDDATIKKFKINESQKDEFNIRTFMELCRNIDFDTQMRFLDFAEKARPNSPVYRWLEEKLCFKPEDYDSAAELLSHLCIFGFSLLSDDDQQRKIQSLSTKIDRPRGGNAIVERKVEENGDDFSTKTFTGLVNNAAQLLSRLSIFGFCLASDNDHQPKIQTSSTQSSAREVIEGHDFRMKIFTELIDKATGGTRFKLYNELLDYFVGKKIRHACLLPLEFLWQQNLIITLISTTEVTSGQPKAQKIERKGKCESEETTRQQLCREFFSGVSITWFKTRCGSISGEDFTVERFGECFQHLPFQCQHRFVNYILDTPFNVGFALEDSVEFCRADDAGTLVPQGYHSGSDTCHHEFIKVKSPFKKVVAGGGGGGTAQGEVKRGRRLLNN